MLEDLGLRVIEEISTRLLGGDDETWVQEFRRARARRRSRSTSTRSATRVAELLAAVYRGDAETDPLNRLVITAGLDRRQVAILRAYRKYRQRVGSRFTESYQNDVLVANSAHHRQARALLRAALRPRASRPTRRPRRRCATRSSPTSTRSPRSTTTASCATSSALIDATLRTNAYNGRTATRSRSSCARPTCRRCRSPRRCSRSTSTRPTMEGIHLRGGPIARGGIRWSDRQDYRTEVYGLMRAQLTKNAVIVPGRRQGRLLSQAPPADRDELKAEVERQYVTLHPRAARRDRQPRRRRGRAPRAACACSTATTPTSSSPPTRAPRRSRTPPTASREEYGFWLDDAFASGGSAGYDHKALGITARGAWESVKRHFRELGVDPAADEFTVVGIGDMSRRRVRQRDAAVATRSGSSPPTTTGTSSSTPTRTRPSAFAERKRLFELAGLLLGRLRPRADLRGRRRLAAQRRSRSRCRRRRARRSAIEDERAARRTT